MLINQKLFEKLDELEALNIPIYEWLRNGSIRLFLLNGDSLKNKDFIKVFIEDDRHLKLLFKFDEYFQSVANEIFDGSSKYGLAFIRYLKNDVDFLTFNELKYRYMKK